jgi:hypothetical protein
MLAKVEKGDKRERPRGVDLAKMETKNNYELTSSTQLDGTDNI